ncbi:Uncharacterised protein [Mycobacteroides abscessus subsp. abscessus]|nr:Uncharacterised protein [Mycobacteroides abscessus subsp. abscessus]SHQ77126.1 Uncharacterised protein [Mycobacteroides abscessus subsp. abscessus]SHT81549.1 Uncharacterised protein [Mycobacteroides abscessus subsp. abscessus]SHV85812.1 Uncharacterised protein [Mycobacteroides abscessus subsp. abscessus]SHW23390.1 Uncharacterised protein [Mycobacteroides abscessus subsp. abscessus]
MLLVPDQGQVDTDERQDDRGDQQDVHGVQTGDQDVAGEVATEQRPVHPGADQRKAHGDAGKRRADTGAGEQVVGQGVSEETFEHRQDEQQRADDPVGLTGTPERTREEDTGHVHHDRRREHQRRPVMDLPHEQTTTYLEADVQGGLVGLGHLHAAQRLIDAVVGHFGHRRVEEQGQIDTRKQQNDEAVQRDLTEHERPVGREDLVDLPLHTGSEVIPRIHRLGLFGCARGLLGCVAHDLRSQNAGPTGSTKSPLATRYPSLSTVRGSCASARAAGPKMGLAKCSASNCDWWHGHRMR